MYGNHSQQTRARSYAESAPIIATLAAMLRWPILMDFDFEHSNTLLRIRPLSICNAPQKFALLSNHTNDIGNIFGGFRAHPYECL